MAPNTLAWLYWNPSREIFTIPWMNHPIAWYGFFFVLGFMLGYFIITPFFTQFLKESKTLSRLDIESWPRLLEYFQDRKPSSLAYQIWQRMNTSTQVQLKTLHSHSAIPLTMKNSILATFNTFWQHSSLQREELENDFKGAIAPVRQTGIFLVDRLCWFLVIGTLIGARLGAVFFYDWSYYQSHPMEIFKVWKGGLASHGGTLGVLLALYLYYLYIKKSIPHLTFLKILDFVAIPIPVAAFCIRIGNFINQEILGTPTQLPWGVIFGDPIDGSIPTPRHPVQLYEGVAYLGTFFLLYFLGKKKPAMIGTGIFSGLLLICIFTSRFILEFWKENQESILGSSSLQMGQWLSLPFILLGFALILYARKHSQFPPTAQKV